MPIVGRFLVGLLTLVLLSKPALAKPAHKKAFAEYFGSLLATDLNGCKTCHLADKPQADDSMPHNPFGARLAATKETLEKAGKKSAIPARLDAIADEDSDGDGVGNLLELLSGHHPGDPGNKPTATELALVNQRLDALRKALEARRWSLLETVRRPAVPTPRAPLSQGGDKGGWLARNPIDAFLAADHERLKLAPRPEAARHVLVRRIYLDLIGLPPTREELRAALADRSGDWFEKIVDRLLGSPRYGERWGRHWMDIWRYSDWAGYGQEVRESQRHIWHWRDWIIESLNEDKGYERMILEMLAADELAPTDPQALRATGFLVRNWYIFNRNTWLDNVVEHTSKAFLGMTMNCARCHDHFFDAITHEEYYRFRAFFEPYHVRTDRVPGEADLNKAGIPRVFDAFLNAPTHLFERGNEASPDKSKALPPGVPALFGGGKLEIQPVQLPLTAYCPDKREFVVSEALAASEAAIPKARAQLRLAQQQATRAAIAVLAANPLAVAGASVAGVQRGADAVALAESDLRLAEVKHRALLAAVGAEQLEDAGRKESDEWRRTATEAATLQRQAALLESRKQQGAARQAVAAANDKARPLAAKALEAAEKALAKAEADLQQPPSTNHVKRALTYPQAAVGYGKMSNTPYPETSTGRRLALARWIADRQNPLAARVAVNHIWLRHMGKALVPSVFDFGKNGRPPINPALLDWLAVELMEPSPSFSRDPRERSGQWSMKHLHRLIVTSNAYRMDSGSDPDNVAVDGENKYHWRMNARRLEAEIVRDSVLQVAGALDTTMGGADIDQNLALTTNRRSIYYRHAPEKQAEFLALFDSANVMECYQRSESIIPQQALALANSSLVIDQARLLARKLAREAGEQPAAAAGAAFIALAFEQVLGRPPTALEKAECAQFLEAQTQLLADRGRLTAYTGVSAPKVPPAAEPHLRARESLIHVLLNHNEFVTIR